MPAILPVSSVLETDDFKFEFSTDGTSYTEIDNIVTANIPDAVAEFSKFHYKGSGSQRSVKTRVTNSGDVTIVAMYLDSVYATLRARAAAAPNAANVLQCRITLPKKLAASANGAIYTFNAEVISAIISGFDMNNPKERTATYMFSIDGSITYTAEV